MFLLKDRNRILKSIIYPLKNGFFFFWIIGDGKIHLNCLGHCDEEFALATLQKALKANTFSKWLRRIQIAEIEKADVDGKIALLAY